MQQFWGGTLWRQSLEDVALIPSKKSHGFLNI